MTAPAAAAVSEHMPRYPNLAGWRGISILSVLACHLLPLGPTRLHLNELAGLLGMCLFFSLSGFLITSTLIFNPSVRSFSIRRLMRIVPLAWLFVAIAAVIVGMDAITLVAHLFFFANVPPYWLTDLTAHLWSLCTEMHFYVFIAVAALVLRRRVFVLIPVLCVGFTVARIVYHHPVSIFTPFRVDEILSGAWLATCVHRDRLADLPGRFLRFDLTRRRATGPVVCVAVVLLLVACMPTVVPMNYARPYLAAALVGITMVATDPWWAKALSNKRLAYVAEISYALYIWHPLMVHGFMGSGSAMVRYAKRIPALLATFGVAHISTRYFEQWFIDLGKQWTRARPSGGREITRDDRTAVGTTG